MNADSKLARSEQTTFEVVAGEAILIHLNTGTYFSLNTIGTEFWEMLDGTHSIQDHAQVIADKYDVDTVMVVSDLLELAEKMAEDDLVKLVS